MTCICNTGLGDDLATAQILRSTLYFKALEQSESKDNHIFLPRGDIRLFCRSSIIRLLSRQRLNALDCRIHIRGVRRRIVNLSSSTNDNI